MILKIAKSSELNQVNYMDKEWQKIVQRDHIHPGAILVNVMSGTLKGIFFFFL